MSSTPGAFPASRWYFQLESGAVVRYVPSTQEISVDPPNTDPRTVVKELRQMITNWGRQAAQADGALRLWLELHKEVGLMITQEKRVECVHCAGTGRVAIGLPPGQRSDWPLDDPVCPDCDGEGEVQERTHDE